MLKHSKHTGFKMGFENVQLWTEQVNGKSFSTMGAE